MRRNLLAIGAGALCLALAPTLALGQSNDAVADAEAGAVNATEQAVGQYGGGDQTASQSATTAQVLPISVAPAVAPQVAPVNVNLPVRVLSGGDDAPAAQSNTAAAEATAQNANTSGQRIEQVAEPTKKAGGAQTATQSATTVQVAPVAAAPAVAAQVVPVNVNAPVRVASPGDSAGAGKDGGTTQDNTAVADAEAANVNRSAQGIGQAGASSGGPQTASQSATTAQVLPISVAPAVAAQVLPVNVNAPVRVLSPGDDPAAEQSNGAYADASATNVNRTAQGIGQEETGGAQSATQSATTLSLVPIGLAPSLAPQVLPLNVNAPVRVLDELPPLPVDPFALLGDPVGTVTGLVGSLPLGALPVDPFALLGDPLGLLGDPLATVTGLLGTLPLGALPVQLI
jgi:hypothetical protein